MPLDLKPATTTAEAYATVIPHEALAPDDPRYVDLDPVRGVANLADDLARKIAAQEHVCRDRRANETACFLVTGHRGCGKTTELRRLQARLQESGFAVVHFDAAVEFDLQSHPPSWGTLLLEMILQIDEQMAAEPYRIVLPDEEREAVATWFAHVVTKKTSRREMEASLETELGADASLPFIARAKAVLKSMVKLGSSVVKEIEEKADQRPMVLLEAVTRIVRHVNERLREQGRNSLVLIVDGLDRIPLRPMEGGLTTHNVLFIHGSSRLLAPPCHRVYTVPLDLMASSNLMQVYPERPCVIPMIHVRKRDGKEDAAALKLMTEVAARRISRGLFAPGVVKELALASGGHIRDFMHLLHDSASGFGERIERADRDRAVAGMVDVYDRMISRELVPALDFVASHHRMPHGEHDAELIFKVLALEYHADGRWHDLHPCVRQAPFYVEAIREHDTPPDTGS